jgi:hypothetical protein
MAYEQRDNSGSLFKNDRKEEGSNHADWNGTVLIGGREYWINAWTKQGKSGSEFYSLSFKPKQGGGGGGGGAPRQQPSNSDQAPF